MNDLAARQAALVAALTGRGPIPAGFDTTRVTATAAALASKRARTVAQAWPGLLAMLGDRYRARFDAYAAQAPLPELGGPLADGRAFVRALAREISLADGVALQALEVDQHWRVTARGLVPRRVPRLGAVHLRTTRCLIVAFGTRQWHLRLAR